MILRYSPNAILIAGRVRQSLLQAGKGLYARGSKTIFACVFEFRVRSCSTCMDAAALYTLPVPLQAYSHHRHTSSITCLAFAGHERTRHSGMYDVPPVHE